MSANVQKSKSIGLVSLFLVSLFVAMVSTAPAVTAVNETTSGTITGTETWTGVMNLDGDLLVAGGAKLIINAGTTINVPADKNIQIQGSICAGDSSCGASQASTGSPIRFIGVQQQLLLLTKQDDATLLESSTLTCHAALESIWPLQSISHLLE